MAQFFSLTKVSQHFKGANNVDFQLVVNFETRRVRLFKRRDPSKNEWEEINSKYISDHNDEVFDNIHSIEQKNLIAENINALMYLVMVEKIS